MSSNTPDRSNPPHMAWDIAVVSKAHTVEQKPANTFEPLDHKSILQLRHFFELLNRWDQEVHEPKAM